MYHYIKTGHRSELIPPASWSRGGASAPRSPSPPPDYSCSVYTGSSLELLYRYWISCSSAILIPNPGSLDIDHTLTHTHIYIPTLYTVSCTGYCISPVPGYRGPVATHTDPHHFLGTIILSSHPRPVPHPRVAPVVFRHSLYLVWPSTCPPPAWGQSPGGGQMHHQVVATALTAGHHMSPAKL